MSTNSGRNKVFLLIIGTLLVANLVLLSVFLLNKEPGRKPRADKKEMIMEFLKKDMGFDQQQLNQYDTLNNRHHDRIKPLFDAMKASKEQQFKVLAVTNYSDAMIDSLTKAGAEKQQHIESMMLGHFRDIRSLCKPGQVQKFDTSFYKLFNRRGEGRKK